MAKWALVAALPAIAGVVVGARFVATSHAGVSSAAHVETRREIVLHVPHAKGPIALDGDLDDDAWIGATARTGAFVDREGGPARPYSDARLVWSSDALYVALYAADENVEATQHEEDAPLWLEDAFHMTFGQEAGERRFEVSPLGTLTDARRSERGVLDYAWRSGARVGHEADGTLNDPSDDDEEWVLEIAIPLSSLGLHGTPGESVRFAVHRCDKPKSGHRVCAAWGEGETYGTLVLD